MIILTTRQRDILKIILEANRPVGSAEMARRLQLTPRQVNYSMKGVRAWLNHHKQDLIITPGAGFAHSMPAEQASALLHEISLHSSLQIILSVSQRQQLLALFLLTTDAPAIVSQLEQMARVSRVTLLKDLDEIQAWFAQQNIDLVRRPNYGIQVRCAEQDCQRTIAKVLWNETPFSGDPITHITHAEGLVFNLERDAALLPLVDYARKLIDAIHLRRTINLVAKAEEQIGGRFTDDAVLHLALVFQIIASRLQAGRTLEMPPAEVEWLQNTSLWPVAEYITRQLRREANLNWKPATIAWVATEMLAAPRSDILPGQVDLDGAFSSLIDELMIVISREFNIPKLRHDHTLENGLYNCIVPACFRQRFNLWFPAALNNINLPEHHEREVEIAREIVRRTQEHSGVALPQSEVNNLVVLLRAAYIRNRTYRFDRIIVVCPSGMATAQLLVARLNARFPYLSSLQVTSMRDLTPALVNSADLILTTVPLPKLYTSSKVIQVHPLLMPEDIEAITRFLS